MPTDWSLFEPTEKAHDWNDYEPVNALGESKEDLQRKMRAARLEGTLGNIGTGLVGGLEQTAQIAANPIGAFARTISAPLNYASQSIGGPQISSEFTGANFKGALETPLEMAERSLQLPPGQLTAEYSPVTGVTRSVEETASGLSKPDVMAQLPVFGAAGPLAMAGRTFITLEMIHAANEAAKRAGEVLSDPNSTMAEKGKASADAFTAYTMASGGAAHVVPGPTGAQIPDFTGRDLPIPEGAPSPRIEQANPIEKGPDNAPIQIRGREEIPLGETPGNSPQMGARVPGPEEPANAQEPTEASGNPPPQQGEAAGSQISLNKGEIDPVMGARFDGEIEGTGHSSFTALKPDGTESTTFVVKSDATPEEMRAKYNEVRERFKDDPYEPRPLPEEAPSSSEAEIDANIDKALPAEIPNPETLAKESNPGVLKQAEGWADEKLKGGGTSSGADVFAAYAVKGAITIARGVKDFAEWSASMVKELGDAVKPHLQDIWDRVNGTTEADKVAKMSVDEFNRFAPTGATNKGYELAKSLGANADRTKLETYENQVVEELKASMQKIAEAKTPEAQAQAFKDAQILNAKKQYFNEAQRMMTALDDINKGMSVSDSARKNGIIEKDLERYAAKPGAAGLAKNVRNISELTNQGGFIQMGPVLTSITEKLFGDTGREKLDAILRMRAGHSAPKTMAASEASGNALVHYAASAHAAPFVAESMALDVLGKNARNEPFRRKLGAVLVEDRLRAIKQSLQTEAAATTDLKERAKLVSQSNKVNSLVGPDKPFSNESSFQAAIRDPEIAEAIKRHKETIQAEAQKFHEETGGRLAGLGLETGAFVNLEALNDEVPGMIFSKGGTKGDYSRPFKKQSVFNKQATGSASNYELDYNRLANRMIRGNYEEYAKRQMYAQLEKDGLAKLLPPNESRPEIGGKPAVKFQIVRRGAETENLWVRPDIASEVRQALNLDGPVSDTAIAKIGSVLSRIQLAGPTDAVWHLANIMNSIAGKQGGKNVLLDIARKVPGLNIIDAGVRIGAKAREVLANNPDIVKSMAEIADIGASRPEHASTATTKLGKLAEAPGKFLQLMDKSARLIRNDMWDNLVERGIVTDSANGRREFINQIGQYNPKLMGVFQRFFKESGASPFIVAGRTFNRAARRAIAMDPGYTAATNADAIKGRVIEGLGVLATLVAVPSFINMLTTGNPNGSKGVQFGQIDTGKKDDKGNPIVIDPAQWVGLRRGLRVTGLNALINGMRTHKPGREIRHDMGNDIIASVTHPWAGPMVQGASIATTGKNTSGFKESTDPNDYYENFKAALKNINPIVHAFFNKNEDTLTGKGTSVGKSLSGAFGVKTAHAQSAENEIMNRAKSWGLASDIPKVKSTFEQREKEQFPESQYKPLKTALQIGDNKKALDEAYNLIDKEPTEKDRKKREQLILNEFNPFSYPNNDKDQENPQVEIKPFATHSKEMEKLFRSQLDKGGNAAYRQAIQDQVDLYVKLRTALYGKPKYPEGTPAAYRR